jgi:chorismate synthase
VGSHSFGSIFRITTWGESHGPAIGVVIDGCPAGLPLVSSDLEFDLKRRAPGHIPNTSPRKEEDLPEILSGVFNGLTTGAPISILIRNQDADPTAYASLEHLLRPGHAGFTYLAKYGIYDHRGGGRASGRETACRVAAGAIAKKLLLHWGITCEARLIQIGTCQDISMYDEVLALAIEQGDSLGGIIEFQATGLLPGLGDPIYEKLEAKLGFAMLSIPASKGFEIGEGFGSASMFGSEHNDSFDCTEGAIYPSSNHAGGVLAGISTGLPLVGRVAFKPTSSIRKPQQTVTLKGERTTLRLSASARHDPCVAIRAVPVVEAMLALVLVDAVLLNRVARL